MRFNVRLHSQTPPGFVEKYPLNDGRRQDIDPFMASHYRPADDQIALYGVQGNVEAYLKTEYQDKRRLFGRRIARQTGW